MARNPAWLPIVGIAAAAAGLAFVAKTLAGEASSKFQKQGGVQYWNANLAPQLVAFLQNAHVEANADNPRFWRVLPGASGGADNALAHVRAIQGRGNAAFSTSNLLDSGIDARGIGEVTQAEVPGLQTDSFAVLPKV